MDPQAAWNELLDALAANELADAVLRAEALVAWLDRKGFPPQTSMRELPDRWNEMICRHVCRKVMATSATH